MEDLIKEHTDTDTDRQHREKLENYYKLHSLIYDCTRWSFLFGREELTNNLPDLPPNPRILEVGCGTGKNLTYLEYLFPDAKIFGIDLSSDMIRLARKKVRDEQQIELIKGAYGDNHFIFEPFDLILLSYSLTMLGDDVEKILQQSYTDLGTGGHIAVVDFHTTPLNWFKRWMAANHVDLSGHLLPLLHKFYTPVLQEEYKAYLGLWDYMLFIGRK